MARDQSCQLSAVESNRASLIKNLHLKTKKMNFDFKIVFKDYEEDIHVHALCYKKECIVFGDFCYTVFLF